MYGSRPPAGAGNALQSQVSRLRRLLPTDAGSTIELRPAGYLLAVEPDTVDAHRFTKLAADGRRALAAGETAAAADLLREALGLWRGPALTDAADAPTAQAHAARLNELRLAATEDRVAADLALCRTGDLVAELRELVAAHPLREQSRALLVRALHAEGRRAEALAAYEDARRILADELGVDPSAELAAAHLTVLRAGQERTGQERTGQERRREPPGQMHTDQESGQPLVPGPDHGALPAQYTTFVGREAELTRLATVLTGVRLVTLTGPGGSGKTRLAVEAAAYRGGQVRFVELAPVSADANLAQTLLGALGLRESGLLQAGAPDRPPDPDGRLIAALAGRPVLLILDNCEHLVGAAATLTVRLLRGCPLLQILVTSREALGVTGETVFAVGPLELPPDGVGPDGAADWPAVRLFLDRAAAVRADLVFDPATVDVVGRVCRALDGLPFAIELAAARLRSLPLDEIATRLDDRFALLSRGNRAAMARHRTLRAVVEWSWDLLTDDERTMAARLAVFAGGATLAAVEAVCGLPGGEAVDVLAGLVEKSLVEAVPNGRYRMLETVRLFAAERLAETHDGATWRAAHARYFLDLARTAAPHLVRADQLIWLRRVDAERDNLGVAIRRSAETGDTGTALRLVAHLSMYWWLRGLRGEAATLARAVLDALPGPPPTDLAEEYAACLFDGVQGAGHGRGNDEARTASEIVCGLTRPTRYPILNVLVGMASGPPSGAELDLLLRYQTSSDPWVRSLIHCGSGKIARYSGRTTEALAEFTAALAGFRAVGERWGTAVTLHELAILAHGRGDWAAGTALCDEALDLAAQLDCTDDRATILCQRAEGLIGSGNLAAAAADYQHATDLARHDRTLETLADAERGLAGVLCLRGAWAAARAQYETALAHCPTGWFIAEQIREQIQAGLRACADQTPADTGAQPPP